MTRWGLALVFAAACGKVQKVQPDAPIDSRMIDAPADAAPDAPPVDPFINGSFEQNYTGWTLNEDSGMPNVGYWGISAPMTFAGGATVHDYTDNVDGVPSCFGVPPPAVVEVADGQLAAFNAQSGPERHRIWQDIALPANAKMLTFSIGYGTNATVFDATNQFLAVEVRDPTSDSILGNLFYTDPTMNPPLTLAMTAQSVSLQPYAGQTVRITVDVNAHNNCLWTVVDNFHVTF